MRSSKESDVSEESNNYNAQMDFNNHHVLVVDDIEINREIMAAMLEHTGITIEFAFDGLEAVYKFSADPEKYKLILMDVQMPKMDGYDATRNIRALPCMEAESVPIVAMTANVFKEDIERCMTAGMNAHIGKPIDNRDLMKILMRYLR